MKTAPRLLFSRGILIFIKPESRSVFRSPRTVLPMRLQRWVYPGLELNATTGLISGMPSTTGSFTPTLEASNQFGSFEKTVVLGVRDYSAWRFSSDATFPGYTGASEISDFPVYLELNDSISGFSYEQFASPFGYDLRFVSNTTNEEIEYEIVKWDPAGQSSFWLKLQNSTAALRSRPCGAIKTLLFYPSILSTVGFGQSSEAYGLWTELRMIWSKNQAVAFTPFPTISKR